MKPRDYCPTCGGRTRDHCDNGNKCQWRVCTRCMSFGSADKTHVDPTKRGPHG